MVLVKEVIISTNVDGEITCKMIRLLTTFLKDHILTVINKMERPQLTINC
jgi:hypothetical protein